jgi:hypothetical protein
VRDGAASAAGPAAAPSIEPGTPIGLAAPHVPHSLSQRSSACERDGLIHGSTRRVWRLACALSISDSVVRSPPVAIVVRMPQRSSRRFSAAIAPGLAEA